MQTLSNNFVVLKFNFGWNQFKVAFWIYVVCVTFLPLFVIGLTLFVIIERTNRFLETKGFLWTKLGQNLNKITEN